MNVHWELIGVLRIAKTHKDHTLVVAVQGLPWMLMDVHAMVNPINTEAYNHYNFFLPPR